MTIIPINQAPSPVAGRIWIFESVLGVGSEERLPEGFDVEGLCCDMVRATGLPTRCYPKIIETSSGRKKGEIIV